MRTGSVGKLHIWQLVLLILFPILTGILCLQIGRMSVPIGDVPGIRDVNRQGDTLSFLYSGDMGQLLRILSEGQITDFSVTDPDLEDIVLHYYEKDGVRS